MIIDYMNIPYKARGTFPESADCWTLARAFLMGELGLKNVPEYYYDVEADGCPVAGGLMVKTLTDPNGRWLPVAEKDWRLGDLLIFRFRGQPWHVGIYLGEDGGTPVFLHTVGPGLTSCIEPVEAHRRKLVDARRWTGG